MLPKEGKTVFDWDGTIRKIDGEVGDSFVMPYIQELAKITGVDLSELTEKMFQTLPVVINNPEKHGWFINGQRVSWATDIYLATQAAANQVIRQLKINPVPDLYPAFKEARKLTDLVFQPGAGEFIAKMREEGGAVIVTNSDPTEVKGEIKKLMGSRPEVKVIGNAKKFAVDPAWQGWRGKMDYSWVRPDHYPDGLSLKQPFYVDVLSNLGQIKLVIGDLSMDLLGPDAMGIKTALKRTDLTPFWELNYFGTENSGRLVIEDYSSFTIPK